MAFSGGTFSRLYDWTTDRDNGVKILASRMDQEFDGMATGLSTCILKDGTQTCTAAIPFAQGITLPDNKTITLGTNSDITIQYDESTNDSLEIAANVEGAALGIVLKADQGDDNADQHKVGIADGGTLTMASKISGSFVSYLTHTPNSTVASSTTAVAGNLTVGGDLTLGSGAVISEAELEKLDGITNGTVAANKAVVVDANKDIASFRNVTLTGELDAGSLDISGDADIDGTLEADAMTLNGTAITATATLDTGISNNNVPKFTSGVADDDFLRVAGTAIEGRSASEVLSDIGGQASLTFGISNTNAVKIDSSSVADDEYARFTANGLESRATSEVLSDIAAAPAAGSSNIVTTGALNSGSITSGFGSIDNGSSAITTTGTITGGVMDVDNININGNTISSTDPNGNVNIDPAGTGETVIDSSVRITKTSGAPTLLLTDNDTSGDGTIDASDGNLRFYSDNDGEVAGSLMGFYVDGSERMRIDSSGNVLHTVASQGSAFVPDTPSTWNALEIFQDRGVTNSASGIAFRSESGTAPAGIVSVAGNTTGGIESLAFMTSTGNATAERMRLTAGGNVGIGTAAPATPLEISTTSPVIRSTHSISGDYLQLFHNGSGAYIDFSADPLIIRGASNAERMRIDSSGNLLVGTTSTISSNTNGGLYVSNAGYTSLFNREDSAGDGNIMLFAKGGTTVGSIGAGAGGFLTIGSPAGTPVYATFANESFKPTNSSGQNDDGSGDLGNSSSRWKDLYLSGGVYLGGTGSANKLDDYEEGTWTPTLNNVTATISGYSTKYTKIGRAVHVYGNIVVSSLDNTDTSSFEIAGLPYTVDTSGFSQGSINRAYNVDEIFPSTALDDLTGPRVEGTSLLWCLASRTSTNPFLIYTDCNSSGQFNFAVTYYTST